MHRCTSICTPLILHSTRTYDPIGGLLILIYTHIENYIRDLYKMLSIDDPCQLEINRIAQNLKINVYYGKSNFRIGNNIILRKSSKQKEWQMFGHELCHCLRHVGNQLNMHYLFVDLQEYQADHFAYHFCVPTFMLQNIKGVDAYKIMNLFNVEYCFALRRLEMYQNKLINRRISIGTR